MTHLGRQDLTNAYNGVIVGINTLSGIPQQGEFYEALTAAVESLHRLHREALRENARAQIRKAERAIANANAVLADVQPRV